MRYYDKETKTEVPKVLLPENWKNLNIIELSDDNIFFKPVPNGKKLKYVDGVPAEHVDLTDGLTQGELRDIAVLEIKRKRNENMDYVTVNYASKDWSFNRVNRQDFFMKLMRGKSFDWKADDATVVTLTIEKANEIADLVEASLTKTFFDAEKEISEL